MREILRRPRYIGKVIWGVSRRDGTAQGRNRHPEPVITKDRPDLRIIDQELWEAVQARIRERSTAYLSRTGGKVYGRPELTRESNHLLTGFIKCKTCGGAMLVGRRTYKPHVQSYYTCSYHVKRGSAVCPNGVCAPVEALDSALLDGIETTVLSPDGLSYLLDKAADAVRRSLAENPERLDSLRRRRADYDQKIRRLVNAITEAEGRPPRSLVEEIELREEARGRVDREIATAEERIRLGHLDVARVLRELEPVLAAWREELHGHPVQARQTLRKLVVGPIVMEPLPEVHGYRWRGELNGGAVLEGEKKYLWCRGRESNPHDATVPRFGVRTPPSNWTAILPNRTRLRDHISTSSSSIDRRSRRRLSQVFLNHARATSVSPYGTTRG